MNRILSTKKLPKALKKKFSDAGIDCIEKNFIQTKSISFETPKLNDYLIFTSKQAVKSVLKSDIKNLNTKPVLCVGLKTKVYLEMQKFVVEAFADYAEDLVKIIDDNYQNSSFTFFCGNIRKNTIPDYFKQNEIAYNEIVVYETTIKPHQIKDSFDGILFYSPSGVTSFLENNLIEHKTCFCIGTTTANALKNKTENIVIADQPTIENVITSAINYYKRL
ncbi:uroporphyrinogen-III synthase [Flavobacterium channae]|uniref:uroporphyrinogen-III synthase n=1 Tax=Flavobacterium channae TaxID=2897181 RepID=UPI001E63ECE7|nr:uroporphyrinogen-III synthase [Flavobacterium channae]UGS23585.1 uroporphyrinogen-III synthase [Flavobacterium channae]